MDAADGMSKTTIYFRHAFAENSVKPVGDGQCSRAARGYSARRIIIAKGG